MNPHRAEQPMPGELDLTQVTGPAPARVPEPWLTPTYRWRIAFGLIATYREQFRDEFASWLEKNFPIWERFEAEANKVWNAGQRKYSARTIGEYLRHETVLREAQDPLTNPHGFKVNDHWWPDLARLYMLMHPDRDGFFERRAGQSARRAA